MSGSPTQLDASTLILACGPGSVVLSRPGVEGYAGLKPGATKSRSLTAVPATTSCARSFAGKRGTGFGMTSSGVVALKSVLFVVRNIASA